MEGKEHVPNLKQSPFRIIQSEKTPYMPAKFGKENWTITRLNKYHQFYPNNDKKKLQKL